MAPHFVLPRYESSVDVVTNDDEIVIEHKTAVQTLPHCGPMSPRLTPPKLKMAGNYSVEKDGWGYGNKERRCILPILPAIIPISHHSLSRTTEAQFPRL